MKDRQVQILKYIRQELSDDELLLFESDLKSDNTLQQEVDELRELEVFSMKRNKINSSLSALKNVHNQFVEESAEKSDLKDNEVKTSSLDNRKWYRIVIALVSAALIYFLYTQVISPAQATHSQLFADNFNPEQVSFQVKGSSQSEDLIKAQILFNKGEYKESVDFFDSYISVSERNIEIQFYKALALLGASDMGNSRAILQQVMTENPIYKDECRWYIALSYLKENNIEQSQKYLSEIIPTAQKYNGAQELLEAL